MIKQRKIPSAIPVYMAAAVWLIAWLIHPIYKLLPALIVAVLSFGAYYGGKFLFPGRVEEYEADPSTGDPEVDRQIKEGRADMNRLKELAAGIDSPELKKELDRIIYAGGRIFDALERTPTQALQVRKFMSYYLPVSVKLLDTYTTLTETGLDGEHIEKSRKSVEGSLDMIATAFEKQVDNLYRDTQMDITAEIKVLETMMAAEGLVGEKLSIH